MKTFVLIACFVLIGFHCIGCTNQTSPQIVAKNKLTLSGKGFSVGVLPDGREVRQYEISRGDASAHFIYVVDGYGTVSVNRAERQGKTTVNKTEVLIDGRLYVPVD